MGRILWMLVIVLLVMTGCSGDLSAPADVEENGINETINQSIIETPKTPKIPIKFEDVQSIRVARSDLEDAFHVPSEQYFTMIHFLNRIDPHIALADEQGDGSEQVIISIDAGDELIELKYDLASNRLLFDGGWVYANDQFAMFIYGLVQPQSLLGEINHLFQKAQREFEANALVADSHYIELEQTEIEEMDYREWITELMHVEPSLQLKYYDDGIEEVKELSVYSDGIVALNRQLLFMDEKYQTRSGVHVGIFREEVLEKLGEPNIKLESRWGYKTGDHTTFHLYFEEDMVKWIGLTMPL